MNKKSLIQQISDLIIMDDPDMADWLKEPSLHSSFQLLTIYTVIGFGLGVVTIISPLLDYLVVTNNGVFLYRFVLSLYALGALFLLFSMTFHYFKYTIEKGNSIKFGNISFFYILSVVLFGLVYYFFFCSKPELFQYTIHISWSPLPVAKTYDSYATRLYFFLYSAFESAGGNFGYLQSNSVLVSIINYAQTLYSFSLVSLLIAGYINQKTNKSA